MSCFSNRLSSILVMPKTLYWLSTQTVTVGKASFVTGWLNEEMVVKVGLVFQLLWEINK